LNDKVLLMRGKLFPCVVGFLALGAGLGSGGIRGGQVVGRTSKDGMTVEDRPVSTPDLLATICLGLGLDPRKQNISNVGRPIRLVDPSAKPIREVI
jgi:hypothetical protein